MKQPKPQQLPPPSSKSIIAFWIAAILVTAFLCVCFFYWTVVPYMQSEDYVLGERQAMTSGDFSVLTNDQFMFDPDTNVEGILRNDMLRTITGEYTQGRLDAKNMAPLDKGIAEMEDYLSNHPSYYTYVLTLADAYTAKAQLTKDSGTEAIAEATYQKDLNVIKGRQDVIFSYAVNLFETGRQEESFAMLRNVIAQEPNNVQAHYQLGRFLEFNGDTSMYDEAYQNLEFTLNYYWVSSDWISSNSAILKDSYQKFLGYYYKKNDYDKFYQVAYRLSVLDPDQKYSYLGVLDYMKANHKIPQLNLVNNK